MNLQAIERALEARHGIACRGESSAVGGASSGLTLKLEADGGALFLKIVPVERAWALEAEAEGLTELAAAGALAAPSVRACGVAGGDAYLALEWIDFAPAPAAAHAALGRALARLHRHGSTHFGWHRDTSLGATRQPNARSASWGRFFAEQRLGYQLELGARRGLPSRERALGARLAAELPAWLDAHAPQPSLLHGDLWAGNWGSDASGRPYVFDPSLYYGDREADLAMPRLFGGFAPAFHRAYCEEWPLAGGWERRAELYELYHLLNHYNLFGDAYLPRVARSLARLADARD